METSGQAGEGRLEAGEAAQDAQRHAVAAPQADGGGGDERTGRGWEAVTEGTG